MLDAVVWALDWRGDPKAALEKVGAFGARLSATIGGLVARDVAEGSEEQERSLRRQVESLEAIGRTGVAICVERSSNQAEAVVVEDLWFQLLHTQISTVQAVSACCVPDAPLSPRSNSNAAADGADAEQEESPAERALTTLRSLVQATFSSLVSASGARGRGRGISFPRLFTRLVETTATASGGGGGGTPYTEFRTILTGMMEAYRVEGDMLVITKHLLDRDVFETVEVAARARSRGWAMRSGTCAGCRLPLMPLKQVGVGNGNGNGVVAGASSGRARSKGKGKGKGAVREIVGVEDGEDEEEEAGKIRIMRTGIAYHRSCLPP